MSLAARGDFFVTVTVTDFDLHLLFANSNILLLGSVQRAAKLEQQSLARHLKYIQAGFARRKLQIPAHIAPRVHDLHVFINESSCRRILREQTPIEFLLRLNVVPRTFWLPGGHPNRTEFGALLLPI